MNRRAPAKQTVRSLALLLSLGPAAVPSCVGTAGSTANDLHLTAPVRVGFEAVADAMQPSCGTLDCHGQAQRNLRLFGARGLRLAATDNPGEGSTTPAEYDATYWAVVAIEPESLAVVVQDGGKDPERWLPIRKGRGTTRHKGGALMHPGDDLDSCLVQWLMGNLAQDACLAAAQLSAPNPAP